MNNLKIALIFYLCFLNTGCNKKDQDIQIDGNCRLVRYYNNISRSSDEIEYKDGILVSIESPQVENWGKWTYKRFGDSGILVNYDTSGIEISKHYYLFNSDNRCISIYVYEDTSYLGYTNYILDNQDYLIKSENYSMPGNVFEDSTRMIYLDGNLIKELQFDSKGDNFRTSNYTYGTEPMKSEPYWHHIILNHHSSANHITKQVVTNNLGTIIDELTFQNVYDQNGLLTYWIQNGVNRTDFTYECH